LAITSPASPICLNAAATTVSITNTTRSGLTYSWAKSNDNWTYGGGTNSNTQTGVTYNVGSQSGVIYLTSTPSGSSYCGTRVDTIRVNRSLTGATISTSTSCYSRGTAYAFSISPAPSTAVTWTVPAGWTVDPNNLNAPNVTITAGASAVSGTISVIANGCSGSISIPVTIAPIKPTPISGTPCVSRGSSYTFSVPAVYGATSYNWTFPAGWSFTPAGANSVTATVSATGVSGTVSVSAVGCTTSAASTYAVSILPPKPGTITYTPATCINKNMTDTLTFSVTPVGGVTYQWVLPAGWVAATNAAPYSNYVVYPNGTAGMYLVKVRGQSTCNSTTYYSPYDSILVTVNGIGTNVTITKTPLDQDGDGIQDGENLTANAISGAKYQWYNASGMITGETTRFLDLTGAGSPGASYYVRVGKTGCQTQANTTSNYAYRVASAQTAADLMMKVKVYPVPVSDVLMIDIPVTYDEGTVEIMDMSGVSLLSKPLHGNTASIPVNRLNQGSYFVVFTIDGVSFAKKIEVVK